jgi:hypothetical protein
VKLKGETSFRGRRDCAQADVSPESVGADDVPARIGDKGSSLKGRGAVRDKAARRTRLRFVTVSSGIDREPNACRFADSIFARRGYRQLRFCAESFCRCRASLIMTEFSSGVL